MPAQRKLSNDQLEILIEFAETHRNIVLGRVIGPQVSRYAQQAWKLVANKLNSVKNGTIKTPEQWRRYWIEFKARTKTKAADSRRTASSNGGRVNKFTPLTSIEERVLVLLGQVAVEGIPEVQIPNNDTKPIIVEESQDSDSSPSEIEPEVEVKVIKKEDSQSRRPIIHRRPRVLRPMRRDRTVPHWAYLELRRIAAQDRKTTLLEKQLEVEVEKVSEMKQIKLQLRDLNLLLGKIINNIL